MATNQLSVKNPKKQQNIF